MPAKPKNNVLVRHRFEGGLASDRGAVAPSVRAGEVPIPFLLAAENVGFTLAGGIRKIGGTSKYNADVLPAGVRGMFEYIRQGSSATPTRRRVVHTGTVIMSDANDGAFTDLVTGLENNTIPSYTVFEDLLIISSSSTVDVPRKWDQTTVAVLGGSPPNFSFSCQHVQRLWAAGDAAFPSRLYYSGLQDPEDWNGATNSGSLDVAPNDGDRITGIASFRNSLIIFKGPHLGSIHVLSGTDETNFTLGVFVEDLGCAGHNLIFPLGSDLGYVACDGSVRSLNASDTFGNFAIGSLSREIDTLFMQLLTISALPTGWAITDPLRSLTAFALPVEGSTVPNLVFAMDWRFDPPRFAAWTAYNAQSLQLMSDPSATNRNILYAGGSDGYVRKTWQPERTIDGEGEIGAFIQTPYFSYGEPHTLKTVQHVGVGLVTKGNYDVQLQLVIGDEVTGSGSVSQIGADVLGPSIVQPFTLDLSVLFEALYRTRWFDVASAGEFREVSYTAFNSLPNQDMEIDELLVVMDAATNESYEAT